MALQCNIDAQGVRVRRVWGWSNLFAAAVFAAAGVWTAQPWLGIVAGLAALLGILGLFEARHQWCVMRAMGIRTRI